ncbi:MAG: D-alanyl-D-alanine carboxypeptidase/D-alanyl-D-alanine-endopeptidase [Betaproteobacteria bacterium]
MPRRRYLACTVLCLFLCSCATPGDRLSMTGAQGLPINIVNMLQAAGIPTDAVGALVIRLTDGATIVSHRPDSSLQPASTMKLVTTIVGLERLGPTRRWHTELRAHAPVEDGVLQGDVFLRGGGDGDLTWEAFGRMLQSLRHQGIRDIRGDLVLDREMFRPPRTDLGVQSFDEEPDAEYNVIPDALLINTNLLRIELEADQDSLRARATPELQGVSLDLRMSLADRACKDWDDGWKVPGVVKAEDGSVRIQLRGEFPRNCKATARTNVLDRNEYVDRLFRGLWAGLGGTFHGTLREGMSPADSRLLASHRSRTLADLLRDINKPSDNTLARLMYLTLGTLDSEDGATLGGADRQIRAWFRQQGIDDAGLVLENGSGLSRTERVRPSQLAALLATEYRSNWAPEFLSSLPVVGLDGTMRLRLRDSPVSGRARMKTGTLNNVVALAGYVPDARGRMHVVVAIINHRPSTGKLWPVGRPIIDALADWVGRSGNN